MAGIAFLGGGEMGGGLAGGNGVVMATAASADHLTVIDGGWRHRYPGRWSRLMTGFTGQGALDMTDGTAAGGEIIMTVDTGAADGTVIHPGIENRRPGRRRLVMAGIALVGAAYMSDALATGRDAVMTGNAITTETAVVDDTGYPSRRVVANIAFVRGGNMGRGFTPGQHIIVTAGTTAQGLVVIHLAGCQRRPACRRLVMTGLA